MFFDEEPVKEEKKHFIWAEKYRPDSLENYLGNEKFKETVSEYLSSGEIPHLLLHSRKPGTGKTTLAKILANTLECDYLYINASDESRIDDIRDKVKSFASTLGFHKLKILVLDECDRMNTHAQMALRNVMETFSDQTRFILTCNYVEKVIEPIQSRCQSFNVKPPEKSTVAKHVASILDAEGVSYELEDFKVLLKYYPDIRKIIQTAQQNSRNGKLAISEKEVIESDAKIKLVQILKSTKSEKERLVDCRQLLADNNIGTFEEYYDYLLEHVDEFAPKAYASTTTTLNEHQFKDAFVANKEMNFAACLIKILEGL
jgi:replication factor C small subunit